MGSLPHPRGTRTGTKAVSQQRQLLFTHTFPQLWLPRPPLEPSIFHLLDFISGKLSLIELGGVNRRPCRKRRNDTRNGGKEVGGMEELKETTGSRRGRQGKGKQESPASEEVQGAERDPKCILHMSCKGFSLSGRFSLSRQARMSGMDGPADP